MQVLQKNKHSRQSSVKPGPLNDQSRASNRWRDPRSLIPLFKPDWEFGTTCVTWYLLLVLAMLNETTGWWWVKVPSTWDEGLLGPGLIPLQPAQARNTSAFTPALCRASRRDPRASLGTTSSFFLNHVANKVDWGPRLHSCLRCKLN